MRPTERGFLGEPFRVLERAAQGFATPWRCVALIVVTGVCFGLIVNSSWKATPDSALYLALGESLARGDGFVFNGEPHTFVPPGFPLMIAAAARVWGASFLTYRVLLAFTGFCAVIACYVFLSRLCGPHSALLIGGIFAVNHTLLEYSTHTLSDVPFALVTLIALNLVVHASTEVFHGPWSAMAALVSGTLSVIRINGLGIPPVTAWGLFVQRKHMEASKRWVWAGLFIFLALTPFFAWQLWKSSFPASTTEGTYFSAVVARHFDDQIRGIAAALWGYFGETTYALSGLSIKTGFLELLLPVIVGWGMVCAYRQGDRFLVPLVVIQYGGLLLSSAGARYLIFLIPVLYLFLALGFLTLGEVLAQRASWAPKPRSVMVYGLLVLGALNLGHNGITLYEARTALEANGPESKRSLPFFEASRWLKTHAPHARVLTTRSRIIHYLSGCRTIPLLRSGVPDHEVWVNRVSDIQGILETEKPDFVFADATKPEVYDAVWKAVQSMGSRLERVWEATSSDRYTLWRIVPGSSSPNL